MGEVYTQLHRENLTRLLTDFPDGEVFSFIFITTVDHKTGGMMHHTKLVNVVDKKGKVVSQRKGD